MMAQNKYAAAIDPQIISEAMQNQKKSDGEYYSTVYELIEKEFRAMTENNYFEKSTIKKKNRAIKFSAKPAKKNIFLPLLPKIN